jgi:hypothetical protein
MPLLTAQTLKAALAVHVGLGIQEMDSIVLVSGSPCESMRRLIINLNVSV